VLALVGESGSGKTTLIRAIQGLQETTAGSIELPGGTGGGRRRRDVQMVFQDPTGALNPRQTIYEIVAEGLRIRRQTPVTRRPRSPRRSAAPGCAPPSGSSTGTPTRSPAGSASGW
jgi:ABC-type dipeptide/oligopeptide/nickel transport system ATPase subunit